MVRLRGGNEALKKGAPALDGQSGRREVFGTALHILQNEFACVNCTLRVNRTIVIPSQELLIHIMSASAFKRCCDIRRATGRFEIAG